MKMPINFFALGVEGERIVGLLLEGEGGKGATFGALNGHSPTKLAGAGEKTFLRPSPSARES